MDNQIKKLERSIRAFPIFSSFSADLIFFVPIDTLFLTLAKGLSAAQITAMATISGLFCIIFQRIILKIVKRVGNSNSLKIGALTMLLAIVLITFGRSFLSMIIFQILYEVSFMFLNVANIILRNNLNSLNREKEYFQIRSYSKILYAIITAVTALTAGYMFNINNYLPMYLSIIVYFIIFLLSFCLYEEPIKNNEEKEKNKGNLKLKLTPIIAFILLSNTIFFAIIKTGQNNSKLFMQYDFAEFLSIENITYYITIIVFISRLARIFGNVIFSRMYKKIKERVSIILTILLVLAFALLILGHILNIDFMYKAIIMSIGFFFILAIRDSFQVYIEEMALNIVNKDEQQQMMISLEIYGKIGRLILSSLFVLILSNYSLFVVILILLILAIIENYINNNLIKRFKNI